MGANVTPAKIVEPQSKMSASAQVKPGITAMAAPLFGDIAANTSTPIPSLSGC